MLCPHGQLLYRMIVSTMGRNEEFMVSGGVQVTVSTVGLVPQIHELCSKSQVALAVSLHASTDIVRDWIAPVNRR